MLLSSGSEKAGQVNPAMKDMEMAKVAMQQKGRCMTQMKAASPAMKKSSNKRVNGAALLSRSTVAFQSHGVGLAHVEHRLFLER
jgi:hypothetical protein